MNPTPSRDIPLIKAYYNQKSKRVYGKQQSRRTGKSVEVGVTSGNTFTSALPESSLHALRLMLLSLSNKICLD